MRGFVQNSRSPTRSRSRYCPRNARLVFAFGAGVFLGWVVLGWWLWPVRWTNSAPWDLQPEYQRAYVGLVAENYWQTGDVDRAREVLGGWDVQDLSMLLVTMKAQASTLEERQRLAGLVEALALPKAQEAGKHSFLSQETIMLGALLSALPLVLMIILAVSPLMRKGIGETEELSRQGVGLAAVELEEEFERLLAGEGQENWGYKWPE